MLRVPAPSNPYAPATSQLSGQQRMKAVPEQYDSSPEQCQSQNPIEDVKEPSHRLDVRVRPAAWFAPKPRDVATGPHHTARRSCSTRTRVLAPWSYPPRPRLQQNGSQYECTDKPGEKPGRLLPTVGVVRLIDLRRASGVACGEGVPDLGAGWQTSREFQVPPHHHTVIADEITEPAASLSWGLVAVAGHGFGQGEGAGMTGTMRSPPGRHRQNARAGDPEGADDQHSNCHDEAPGGKTRWLHESDILTRRPERRCLAQCDSADVTWSCSRCIA